MNDLESTMKAAEHLKAAQKLLNPDEPLTTIELLAAWHRGVATITDPVLFNRKKR